MSTLITMFFPSGPDIVMYPAGVLRRYSSIPSAFRTPFSSGQWTAEPCGTGISMSFVLYSTVASA